MRSLSAASKQGLCPHKQNPRLGRGVTFTKGAENMNVRKHIDYSGMYESLDRLMEQQLSQMELYCGIGKAVCRRTEKGAAVMASEYLNKQFPM